MDFSFLAEVLSHPPRSQPAVIFDDEDTVLWIDWREMEDAIVAEIAHRLQLPELTCKVADAENAAGYETVIGYLGRSRKVAPAEDRSTQCDTLREVQHLLGADYQIRYVGDTNGSDTAGVVVGPAQQWDLLYQLYGKRLNEHFVPIAELPDIFTTPGNELDAALAKYANRVG